jgi:hypothetical protein
MLYVYRENRRTRLLHLRNYTNTESKLALLDHNFQQLKKIKND